MRLVKLVRDDIGKFLDGRHDQVSYEPITNKRQVILELRKKLIEEAAEYALDPSIEEAADVYEVICCLVELDLDLSYEKLVETAKRKREERGGFWKGTGMWVKTTK